MENNSYKKGKQIGEMLYMKMFRVDVTNTFPNKAYIIKMDQNEINTLTRLQTFYDKSKKYEDWNKILYFYKELDLKYLPHTVSEYIDFDGELNLKSFKEGLIDYLWSTDFCSYSIDEDDIKTTIEKNIIEVELKISSDCNILY